MTGLAPKTLAIIEAVSSLSCIKDFVLVGGTSISVQLNHRLSEDLDFANGFQFQMLLMALKPKPLKRN